jgi:two-component system, NarL family, response regulator DevR
MQPPALAPLRVGLVDDHEVIATAVRAALRQTRELELVASAPTVDALFARAVPRLHLVVLDLRLADGSSPANNVDRLMEAGCNVIAFTSGESPYLLRTVARTPVLGIVRKSEPLHALTNALLRAAHGQPVMTAEWASTVENDPLINDAKLSKQEQKMLALFADGNTAPAVAEGAGIRVSTIEDYVRRIRQKYAKAGRPATTKVDLYKRAVEDGFLPAPNEP